MVSEAGAIVARLMAGGMTGADIGRAIGRDRSLVSQIGRGVKSGASLVPGLQEVERRRLAGETRPAVVVARRTTASGRQARVRTRSTVKGRGWSSTTIKAQAAASGGTRLAAQIRAAADDGEQVGATITYARSVVVQGAYGKRGRNGPGGTVDMELDVSELMDALDAGASAVDALNAAAEARGYIPAGVTAGQVREIEVRSF